MKDQDTLFRKVQALLALAGNNPNENEAKAAALKAQELIAKYSLDMSQASGDKIEYTLVRAVHSNNEGYRKPLAVIIGTSFRCRAILFGNIVHFFGRKQDAEACAEVFNYLYRVSHNIGLRLEREARKTGENTHGVANSYWKGFMAGLKISLDKQCKALAVVVPQDVNDEVSKRFNLQPGTGGMRDTGHVRSAFAKGYEDGRHANNRNQLEAKNF